MHYCNKICQQKGWKAHKVLCNAIRTLSRQEEDKIKKRCEYVSHLDPEQHKFLVDLVGERCLVKAKIEGRKVTALWDTGSQVSLISSSWLKKNVPHVEVKNLSEILDQEVILEGVSGKKIPYTGYTLLNFQLGATTLNVPFLVTSEKLVKPILGYNLISAITKIEGKTNVVEDFKETFQELPDESVSALINFLQTQEPRRLARVITYKQGATIRANSSISVPCKVVGCRIDRRMPVLFEPTLNHAFEEELQFQESFLTLKASPTPRVFINIINNSSCDVKLPGKMCVGELHLVSSVTPTEVRIKEKEESEGEKEKERVEAANKTSNSDVKSEVGKKHCQVHEVGVEMLPQGRNTDVGINTEEEEFRLKLDQLDFSSLTGEEEEAARKMLLEEKDSFSKHADDIGDAKELQMELNTTDEIPVQKNYITIQKPLYQEVKNHIQNLLNRNWITESKSSWSSPVVVVRKKSGEMRLCIDYRGLNAKTIKDRHPLPRIQETLDNLGGSHWFSVLDQSRAYHQGYLSPESRKKSAFITPWGLFEFVRIPFGMSNSPSCFQRFINSTLGDYQDDFATGYLDDIIVYSNNFEDHLLHISKVLKRLRSKGVKLKLGKCKFFQKEVKFLGRIVNSDGYRMDEESIEAVRALKDFKPVTVGQVRQILGLVGYHRRHIQDYAKIAKPLTNLLMLDAKKGREEKKPRVKKEEKARNDKSKCGKKKVAVPSSERIHWNEEHQIALNKLIDQVTSAPILAYPDYNETFYLHTDASGYGLGSILYQKQKGKDRVIGYGSRTLKPAEVNYHSTKLEFLSLKWAVTEKFKDYLMYADMFQIYTDNNPLVYLMDSGKLNATSQRWVSELCEYNFKVYYRPGKVHADADCLSRLPLDISGYMELCTEEVDLNTFEAIVAGIQVQAKGEEAWVMPLFAHLQEGDGKQTVEKKVTLESIKAAQKEDNEIGPVLDMLVKKKKKVEGEVLEGTKLLLREIKRLQVDERGVLCRKSGKLNQLVLPECFRKLIYENLHQEMGHLGVERTFQLARSRVYWPKMYGSIENFIQKECRCVTQKRPSKNSVASLQSIHSSCPMELVGIDYLHLERSSGGHEYILLLTDHFSGFSQGYATKNKSALTAAKILYDEFVPHF